MSRPQRPYFVPWWVPLGGSTLLLLTYVSPWMKVYNLGWYRFKAWILHLDGEMNLGVWWAAVLLLLSAGLFFETRADEGRSRRRAYLQLALLMAAMTIDEIGSLHEWVSGIGGWTALAPFGLVGVLLAGDSLRRLWPDPGSRVVFWLLVAGMLVLATVPIQEYIEHNVTTKRWGNMYGRYIEEATELAGAGLILTAAVFRRRGLRWGGGIEAAVPDPMRMPYLLQIVLFGFLGHLIAAQAPLLTVGRWDGSPAAVYPFAVFFLLACYAYWVPYYRSPAGAQVPEVRAFWAAVGLFFLACSIGTMQNLWGLFGGLVPGLKRGWFQQLTAVYSVLIFAAWFFGLSLWRRYRWRLLWLLALPFTVVILYELHHPSRKHLAAGLFAVLCAAAFLRMPRAGADPSFAEAPRSVPAAGAPRPPSGEGGATDPGSG